VGGYDRKNPDINYWYLLRLTQATLVGALGLAAFAAAKISPKMTDDDKQANLTLREASAALCLGAGAVCQVVAALFLKRPLVRKGAFYMLCVSSLVVRLPRSPARARSNARLAGGHVGVQVVYRL
jgi:hypothetical protein